MGLFDGVSGAQTSDSDVVPFLGIKPTATPPSVTMGAIMDQLRQEGVPESNLRAAAAHLAGQADAESGFNPNLSHDGGIGYGLYGANGDRLKNMLAWQSANGYPANSLEGQARYMAHEAMNGYPTTRNVLMNATPGTLGANTGTVTADFERPAVINDRRAAVAKAFGTDPGGVVSNSLPLGQDDQITSALFNQEPQRGPQKMAALPGAPDTDLTPPDERMLELARAFGGQAATMPVHGYGDMIRGLSGILSGNMYGGQYRQQQQDYNKALAQKLSGANPAGMADALIQTGVPSLVQAGVQAKMTPREADQIVKVGTDITTGGDLMKIQKKNPLTGSFQLYELDGKTPYDPNGGAVPNVSSYPQAAPQPSAGAPVGTQPSQAPNPGGSAPASPTPTQSGIPASNQPTMTPQQAVNAGLHGEDLAKTLSPPIATRVRAIAAGDEVVQRGDKMGMQLLPLVYAYDPSFNRTDAEARFNFKKSFTDPNHTNMKQSLALNNMLHHGEQYMDTILPNMPDHSTSPQDWLSAKTGNFMKDPNYRQAYTLGDFLGPESVKVASGAEGGEAERQAAAQRFYPEAGKSNISASLRTTAGVGEDKLKALIDQWHAVMGARPIPPDIINPRAQDILGRMKTVGLGPQSSQPDSSVLGQAQDLKNRVTGNSPQSAAPAPVTSKADYDKLPKGAEYIAPDGSHRQKQ